MEALKHQKMVKAKLEMEKLKKLNQGAADFMKNQKKEQAKGLLNKGIQDFAINTQAGMAATNSLKNKNRVPDEVNQLFDQEGLGD